MSWSIKFRVLSKDSPFHVALLVALNSFLLCVLVPSVEARPEGSVQDGGISISSFPSQEAALQHFFLQQQQLAAAAHGGHRQAGKLPESIMEDVAYFDRVNIDSQLNNRRFVELQVKCLIYGGPCDIFGRKAKALLPSIILDNCRWCSPSQRTKLSRVIVHLQQHYPAAWSDALKKFGSSPKGFLTAGQGAPNNHAFFGKLPNEQQDQGHHQQQHVPSFPQIIYIQVPANNGTASGSDSHPEASSSAASLAVTQVASPAPEVIPAMESPTPFVEPTPGPRGYEITSSAEPPSTSAMESTISARSTTSRP